MQNLLFVILSEAKYPKMQTQICKIIWIFRFLRNLNMTMRVGIMLVPPPFAEGARGWVDSTSASQAKLATANSTNISVISKETSASPCFFTNPQNHKPTISRTFVDFVLSFCLWVKRRYKIIYQCLTCAYGGVFERIAWRYRLGICALWGAITI